jgi:hypothetical protein
VPVALGLFLAGVNVVPERAIAGSEEIFAGSFLVPSSVPVVTEAEAVNLRAESFTIGVGVPQFPIGKKVRISARHFFEIFSELVRNAEGKRIESLVYRNEIDWQTIFGIGDIRENWKYERFPVSRIAGFDRQAEGMS